MYLHPTLGWLEVITGCTYSGKTEELRRRLRRALIAHEDVRLFVPTVDGAPTGTMRVEAPTGDALEARAFDDAYELLDGIGDHTELVAVDEGQFCGPAFPDVVDTLLELGVRVIVSALDTDFRGEPFPTVADLLARADEVTKLHAICVRCGNRATRTQRLVDGRPSEIGEETIRVRDEALYEPRCRACHLVPQAL